MVKRSFYKQSSKRLGAWLLAGLVGSAGCGGGSTSAVPEPVTAPRGDLRTDRRTELERRQEAACRAVGERTTACAVADAKARNRADLTEARYVRRNTEKFMEQCLATPMSSRQVRVFEVCYREETACEPFFACLEHAKPQPQ